MSSLCSSIHRIVLLALAIAVFAFASLVTPACTSVGPLKQPQEAWVRADRTTYDFLAPRFARYVTDDPELMPVEKKALLDVLVDWRVRLEQAEKAIAPPLVVDARERAPREVHDIGLLAAVGPPGDGDLDAALWVAVYMNSPALGLGLTP